MYTVAAEALMRRQAVMTQGASFQPMIKINYMDPMTLLSAI